MAAFLTIDLLRAHVVPAFTLLSEPVPPRRVISARWVVGLDDRLVCCWDIDTADPSPPMG